jgi:DNA-binding PadR family transcriptional regulator
MPRSLGITSLQILGAIRAGTCYGLDIVTRTGLPSGTVYPTLGRLKRAGLVKAKWEDQRIAEREGRPRRRYYELTSEGELALAKGASQLARVAADLVDGGLAGRPSRVGKAAGEVG